MYNETCLDGVNTTLDSYVCVNNGSNGALSIFILGILFLIVVVVVGRSQNNTLHGVVAGSLFCMIIGGLMLAIEIIAWEFVGIMMAIFFISLIAAVWQWRTN